MYQLYSYRPKRFLRFLQKYSWKEGVFIFGSFLSGPLLIYLLSLKRFIQATEKKKKLIWTSKVSRLFFVTSILFLVISWDRPAYVLFSIPFLIIFSSFLLIPLEKMIEKKYLKEAVDKLQEIQPLVIGITGSYGKTSIKHILYHFLKNFKKTLMTPGSTNTLMGITKHIRENLVHQEIYIVEMGARELGNIKEICDLVHPDIGMIPSYVGKKYLESLESQEILLKMQVELAESSKSVFFNLDSPFLGDYKNKFHTKYYSLGDKEANLYVKNIEIKNEYTYFTVVEDEKEYFLKTKLLGKNHISNILAALIVARSLGVSWTMLETLTFSLPQFSNNLELKKENNITILNNYFNSSMESFEDALEVMKALPGKNKIIITPGFEEEGEETLEDYQKFAEHIAKNMDRVILVGKYVLEIESALHVLNYPQESLFKVNNFKEANIKLKEILQVDDVVLFQSDVPDDMLWS
jgi:UDP-N-acetylmuramoyl-tripeptide--D-alanyl-D-alanine ligase